MLTVLRNSIHYTWCGCILLAAHAATAAPTLQGQSGYVNMPNADVGRDGDLSLGYSYDSPYGTIWASSTLLPFMQVTGRYVSISGTPQFADDAVDPAFRNYGRYKDKVFDLKARLVAESVWMPAIAVGATDLQGTGLFKGRYVVATKTFGPARQLEASIGVGGRRPDGVFGGVRWQPVSAPNWAVVAEYDANDYSVDLEAVSTGAAKRRKGAVVGLEYRWGWLGAQIARHPNHFSANVYATIPLAQREFIPKVLEPAYFKPKTAPVRLSAAAWREDPRQAAPLINALSKQDFKNIRITLDGATLRIALTNSRISQMGRAVGRAARTALAFAPTGTHALHITYTKIEQPIATYEFQDIGALSDYLAGASKRETFLQTVQMRYATPADTIEGDRAAMVAGVDDSAGLGIYANRDGNVIQVSSEDREGSRFRITPKLGFFFNDPSGALRYELSAASAYNKRLGNGLYLNGAVQLNLVENVSKVTQGSNSLLPHVRSDVAEYNRGGRFKLNRLMLNQYLNPAERWYARVSGGFYEEMYRGVGGQVLYLPKDERWAADLSVDALEQRGYKGWLDKLDYRTVTAIGALHYRLPYGMTVTARAGRFLARDTGVRMEFKRRFPSGVEVGAWYTKTNGNDITSPGSPSNPYHDKGVFVSIPLKSMLPADTQATAGVAIGPWTRDVGQMVASPGDLYGMIEQPRRDMTDYDGLGNFAERPDEQKLPAVTLPDRPLPDAWPLFRLRLEQSKAATPPLSSVAYGTALAGGAVLASALLDKPVDKYVSKHGNTRLARSWNNFGKNMPIALMATSGVAVAMGDERMQNMGIISLQAVAASLGVSAVGKYVVGRARPEENRGAWARVGEGESRTNSSFPSGHSAVAFAAITPFAQEYDAPWLYGVAAVSSMGRLAGRKHWVSDTVAGGIVGYATGTLLWKGQRDNAKSQFAVLPGPKEISVSYQGKF
ncbi:YjbH domain-containing protein [Massilia sp. TSP1-1-2]|uniref:YjbH domain-containing protein n=1 Tax=Massilia sp. TSP1-1-2 TaxID=2804649 RepID=UPI003CF41232